MIRGETAFVLVGMPRGSFVQGVFPTLVKAKAAANVPGGWFEEDDESWTAAAYEDITIYKTTVRGA